MPYVTKDTKNVQYDTKVLSHLFLKFLLHFKIAIGFLSHKQIHSYTLLLTNLVHAVICRSKT